jgi:hypothetical protein
MRYGKVITISLQHAAGALDDAPEKKQEGRPPSGHYFHPGVMSDDGYYAAARLESHTATSREYTVIVPKAVPVRIFVDSDLNVVGPDAASVPVRRQSAIELRAPVDERVSFSVQ